MTTKQELHDLIDALPDDRLEVTARLIERIKDPVEYSLITAPSDDEPETDEELEGLREAYDDIDAGRLVTSAEVRRELGL